MPHISIVIPACNSRSSIKKCLEAIMNSTYKDYELIVIDDGSQDETVLIAKRYTDKIITHNRSLGRAYTRANGIKAAKGEIIVSIDSDIVVKPDTLSKIANYFSEHKETDAITGLLSKEHPNLNFFSQYKNLYMHYIFSKLPEKVTFLYGSIYALRRQVAQGYGYDIKTADDTALGQKLFSSGKNIAFLKNLEVGHLKRYDISTFIKNDFHIPFDWAKIFLKFKGWKQLGKNKTGFAHSPKEQLISVILAPPILMLGLLILLGYSFISLILILILLYFFLNFHFLAYLRKETGLIFASLSFFVTFLDNIVMALGILCGFAVFFKQNVFKK